MENSELFNRLFGSTKGVNANDIGKLWSESSDDSPSADGDCYDWKSAYESTLADFNSYRNRVNTSKAAERRNLVKELVLGFLDIVDYIIYTYKAKNSFGTLTEEDRMILNRLYTFLGGYGVVPMGDDSGKPFDHNRHDAIMTDSSGLFEDNTVVMVLNQGYLMDGEVLRHAKVSVAMSKGNPPITV